uniref:Uncharacterized protein n=1 Tax=Setaria viridis TaxID=4556 RepID=A0A4U6W7I9_SETVI|nr:hypothetical protein SEVIR_1G128650v2 [Setaria viridis]
MMWLTVTTSFLHVFTCPDKLLWFSYTKVIPNKQRTPNGTSSCC